MNKLIVAGCMVLALFALFGAGTVLLDGGSGEALDVPMTGHTEGAGTLLLCSPSDPECDEGP